MGDLLRKKKQLKFIWTVCSIMFSVPFSIVKEYMNYMGIKGEGKGRFVSQILLSKSRTSDALR